MTITRFAGKLHVVIFTGTKTQHTCCRKKRSVSSKSSRLQFRTGNQLSLPSRAIVSSLQKSETRMVLSCPNK